MFKNLYQQRDASFRDHNYSDFWNGMGGGDAVEKVSSDEIEVMLARSFQPVSGRPYRFEGLEPDFCPIILMTLSELCCESFLRSHAELPIEPRDYYLSKLFQFVQQLWTARYGIEKAVRFSSRLHESLDEIPADRLQDSDWYQFWSDCHDDCVAEDEMEAASDLFQGRIRVVVKARGDDRSKRRSGPKVDSHRLRLISKVITHWTRNDADWRDALGDVCSTLDRSGISAWDGRGAKVSTSWSDKLKTAGSPDKIRKQIQYALNRVPFADPA